MVVGPEEVRRTGPVDRIVGDADVLTLGARQFDVLEVGGHTLGHIAYHLPAKQIAFVGDVLFSMGCG